MPADDRWDLTRRLKVNASLGNNPHYFSPTMQQPKVGHGLLIIEASRSHSDTPHSVGILWTGDQPGVEASTCTPHNTQTSMPLAGFESASERPQTHVLDRAGHRDGQSTLLSQPVYSSIN